MIVTGLVTTVKLVRTFGDLTYPSFPRKTLITLPTYLFPRWTFSSAINTRSPIAKLRRGFIHFALSCSVDTYSNSQPFQKMLDVYSTCTTCCNGGCCIYGYLRSQKIQRANLDLLSITINDSCERFKLLWVAAHWRQWSAVQNPWNFSHEGLQHFIIETLLSQ